MSWLNLNDQQAFGLSANDMFYVSARFFWPLLNFEWVRLDHVEHRDGERG